MCGIVGALAQRDVSSILLEGLYRLEYRGYDSAGIALIDDRKLERFRALGKVRELEARMSGDQPGHIGIAHTPVGLLTANLRKPMPTHIFPTSELRWYTTAL